MTSKQRAYLRSLAMTMEPIFQVGKASITPEFTEAIAEAFADYKWKSKKEKTESKAIVKVVDRYLKP